MRKLITVNNEEVVLEGVLTWPEDMRGSVGCVILLHPWGAWDMDGSLDQEMSYDGQEIKLFLQLREVIVPEGFAVFRFNCRFVDGKDGAKPQFADRTYDGMIGDVRAAIQLMRNLPGVDPDRIWLLGILLGSDGAGGTWNRSSLSRIS